MNAVQRRRLEPTHGPTHPARNTTLWTACRTLTAKELTELLVLASAAGNGQCLRQRMKILVGNEQCLRLEKELLRVVTGCCSGRSSAETSGAMPTTEIIRQLEGIISSLFGNTGTPTAPPALPWRLEVAPSSTSGGGDGVFLRGRCEAGSVLAIYPGVVYTAADLPLMREVLEGNHYTLFLRNGVILDGRIMDGRSSLVFERAKQRDREAFSLPPLIEEGALAVGHKVNHPPPDVPPNVYVLPLDLGRYEHVGLHRYLPVVHAHLPVPDGDTPWKRTAVLIASRSLCDEELWLDYKLRQDAHQLPSWYSPTSPGEMGHAEPRSPDLSTPRYYY